MSVHRLMLLAIHPGLLIILYTLPETNSSPLKKWWLGDDSFLLERSTFRGETLVSGRVPPNILPKILSLGSPTTLDGWAYHPDEMKRAFFRYGEIQPKAAAVVQKLFCQVVKNL